VDSLPEQTKISIEKVPRRWVFFVFLFGLLGSFGLLQNLPFTFGDDLGIIDTGRQTSWSYLVRQIFNPQTPAWYAFGGDYNRLTTRVLQTFFFKVLYAGFGLRPNLFWLLQSLGFAGVGMGLFFFLFLETRNKALSVAGSVFFFLLPPVYRALSWISDPEIIAESFLVFSFLLFIYLDRTKPKAMAFWMGGVCLILAMWFGMKIKETVRIGPVVMLLYLALRERQNLFKWLRASPRHWFLFGVPALLLLSIIPWSNTGHLQLNPLSQKSAFHLSRANSLKALLSSLGMYYVPVLISLATVYFIPIRHSRKDAQGTYSFGLLLFFGVWTFICLAGTSLGFDFEHHPRYLTTVLIPLTLFSFALFKRPLALIQEWLLRWRYLTLALLLGFPVLFQTSFEEHRLRVTSKLDEILFHRYYYGGLDTADFLLTQKLYEDRFHVPQASWKEIDDFFHAKPPGRPREFGEIRIKEWDPDQDVSLERLERTNREWGTAYVLSFNSDLEQKRPELNLLWQGQTDNRSLYSLAIGKLKKKAYRKVFLYKFSPLPAGQPSVPG